MHVVAADGKTHEGARQHSHLGEEELTAEAGDDCGLVAKSLAVVLLDLLLHPLPLLHAAEEEREHLLLEQLLFVLRDKLPQLLIDLASIDRTADDDGIVF